MQIQLAGQIFLMNLSILKKTLDLLEFKYGKESDSFKFMKKQTFDFFYNEMKKLFKKLEEDGLIKKCPNKCNMRQGYQECICKGSGYLNI